ncbi:hypothetical protein [Actinoplanes sp. NPDC051851]|uniref:hypothetical protein n=1 Tax=Actinoplanes sp. NPDC051851 TaxID=3154753 RepID=UPI0034231ED2
MADIQFPNTTFGAGLFNAQIKDNNGLPSNVLEAGAEFQVLVDWHVGDLAAALLGGLWEVNVYVESLGPGPEKRVGTATVAVNGGRDYYVTVTVPKNSVDDQPKPPVSGAYKLVTVLRHSNFGRRTEVGAIYDGPTVLIA